MSTAVKRVEPKAADLAAWWVAPMAERRVACSVEPWAVV